jgi:alpha-tubulin suppressor-like RCC1 family protein
MNGTAVCWGNGLLGNGSAATSAAPVPVSNLTGIQSIAAGRTVSCALKTDGTVWCWGSNTNGELGQGTIDSTQALVPVQVTGLTNARAIACARSYACAVKTDGTVWCWGDNTYNALGVTGPNRGAPVQSAVITTATNVALGANHTCVLLGATQEVWCWGANSSGESGAIAGGFMAAAQRVVSVQNVVALGLNSGASHSCVVGADGLLKCWGLNSSGALGASSLNSPVPTPVAGIP